MGCCFNTDNIDQEQQRRQYSHQYTSQHQTYHQQQYHGSPSTDRKPFQDEPSQKHFRNPSPKTQSQRLREEGNENYKHKRYEQAIRLYQQAMKQPGSQMSCYTNLALAYKANQQEQRAIQTIDQMIENPLYSRLQEDAIFRKGLLTKARCQTIVAKNYCLKGQFSQEDNMRQLRRLEEVIIALIKLQNPPNPLPEAQTYRKNAEQVKIFLNQSVVPYCKSDKLIDFMRKKLPQREKSQKAHLFDKYFSGGPREVLQGLQEMVEQEKKGALNEDHEWVTDPITYMYKDPAIVPSGISYELTTLQQHFKNNGYKDPITHQLYQLGEKVIVNNHALQAYVRQSGSTLTKEDLQALQL